LDANLTRILTWRPLRLLDASRTPVTGPCQARHHAGRVHLLGEGRAAAMYGSGSEDIEQVGVELVLGWDDLARPWEADGDSYCDDPVAVVGGPDRDSDGWVPELRPVDPRRGRHAGRRAVVEPEVRCNPLHCALLVFASSMTSWTCWRAALILWPPTAGGPGSLLSVRPFGVPGRQRAVGSAS
jgi:hypothetical protein